MLHASDLSGPVRPWAVSSVWAQRLHLEFQTQVANENLLGLPPSTFLLVRKRHSLELVPSSSLLSLPRSPPAPLPPTYRRAPRSSRAVQVPKPQLELSFIDAFARPAWSAMARLVGEGVDDRLADLTTNRARWESYHPDEDSGKDSGSSLELR